MKSSLVITITLLYTAVGFGFYGIDDLSTLANKLKNSTELAKQIDELKSNGFNRLYVVSEELESYCDCRQVTLEFRKYNYNQPRNEFGGYDPQVAYVIVENHDYSNDVNLFEVETRYNK